MDIESTKTHVNFGQKDVYNYLMDLNNVEFLLPDGKFTEWEGEYEKCSFKMQGFSLTLIKDHTIPHTEIKLISGKDSPIDFDLNIYIAELSKKESEVFLVCEARVNSFLKMMIEKPLTSLFNHMSEKLARVKI